MASRTIATSTDSRIEQLRQALVTSGFEGDIEVDLGAREVASTDNSIYRVLPAAVVYPRSGGDINRIVRAAMADAQAPLALCARGGNTGTNGQSLSEGVIVDFARYMNAILAISIGTDWATVTVEPGVVLDQLNARLAEYGLFFPPMVSTASRATIGGMVATDASGKGSRRYGKTSDYIEALDVVFAGGLDWTVSPMTRAEAERIGSRDDAVGAVHREAVRIAMENAEEIVRVFPDMNRGLTGYNLQKMYQHDRDRFFLAPLLSGSEGTLAITKSITLRVVPKPATKALVVVRYDSFDAGLRDVERLLAADPLAIEIIDDKILDVARTDVIWHGISSLLGDDPQRPVRAISFIEYAGDAAQVNNGIAGLETLLADQHPSVLDWKVVRDAGLIGRLWGLREKAVGLLARLGGAGRQGVPFVEDTAVPPARLADYVADFRSILDSHGLKYGMFGHADVGCLHVRPLMDLKDPQQAALIRPVSDAVAKLTKSYGGLLWGEHGRGFRGEYSPFFFGPKLYAEIERLKSAFDPANIFNPGKLATADPGKPLKRIDTVTFRGTLDKAIPVTLQRDFDRAMACNGNGACFSWDAIDAMCPSYKSTRDRAQSPKGRASLLRAWARLSSQMSSSEFREMEAATARSLSTCLSCKACTTLCPVKVDVPSMKSRFLETYHARHGRPMRHYVVANLERLLALGRSFAKPTNALSQLRIVKWLLMKGVGFIDLPMFAPVKANRLPPVAKVRSLRKSTAAEIARTVILVEDTFTSSFEGALVEAAADVMNTLGYRVLRLPPRGNGKALHVLGFRTAFSAIAKRRVEAIARYEALGATLVGLDAATSLMYEQEYREFADSKANVIGLETLLARDIDAGRWLRSNVGGGRSFRLFSHCTEQALRPQAADAWHAVFRHFGMAVTSVRTGCCGMAGMFGHEYEHQAISKRLFDLSWRDAIGTDATDVLVTGFSCRCQVERMARFRPLHPVEALHQALHGMFVAKHA
ncbi:MAG TPA: FAD-binding and (Fe-S)-binding domain-containing protein [Paraburkholderia sp.]|uniref:FAD-binding and (Fe-S)-binding domain-containing protein n=1 Tax=Paraburkholderia sp. TaxID=1926495 RepID=UPI002B49E8BF|nr:FAD-binding and (Fe-S)-binding domain-containing protein [Paraburkholderia sp.]HKR38446.1 FAD-binding and (Fe-S)-binding domain-containing protein [Paraburkholderia sp.]